jgi:hypothetical protein
MKFFLIPILLGASLCASADLHAHGGTYKGPEDTVPPGGGGLSTPPTPTAPPGSPPTPPGKSPPGTSPPPGGVTPPNTPPGRPPTGTPPGSGGGALPLENVTGWEYWWEFNKDRFLNLRAHLQDAGPATDPGSVLTGLTGAGRSVPSLVNEPAVRDRILPALHAAARSSTDPDVLTGSMIAIARIGRDEDGRADALFRAYLGAASQEVAETAAICFGVLKDPASLQDVLPALMFDEPAGRDLVGGREVPARSRAFAAYAVGLIGGASREAAVQELAATLLLRLLETDRSAVVDLRVAAVLGLGLIQPDDPRLAARIADALGARLAEGRDDALVLAHHPATIAKVLRDSPAGAAARESALDLMLQLAQPRADAPGLVRQGAVLALGMLARPEDPRSAEIFAALREMRERGRDLQSKNFTAIAMAYLAAAAPDFDGVENEQPATRFLLGELRRSDASYEAWSAVALGVLGFLRHERGLEIPPLVYDALLDKFDAARAPELLGACAIGLGLVRHGAAAERIAAKMDRIEERSFLGYGAVALGMLGAQEQKPRLLAMLQEERRDPDLLRQAATGLGLLGDVRVRGDLLEMLAPADGARVPLAVLAAAAIAIGYVGDGGAVTPLLTVLENAQRPALARSFAAVALGLLADKEWLPWNAGLAADLHYGAAVATLIEKSSSNGILDLL